jgi:hypothetical protein
VALKRKHSWPEDLHKFLHEHADKPFTWGSHDCALFVCNWIENATGVDVAAEFRGQYKTKLGAAKIIRKVTGGESVEHVAEHVTKQHGIPELPSPLFAQRGDVVLFDGAEGPALGIVHLTGKHAIFAGEGGLQKIELNKCRRAWRLGHQDQKAGTLRAPGQARQVTTEIK